MVAADCGAAQSPDTPRVVTGGSGSPIGAGGRWSFAPTPLRLFVPNATSSGVDPKPVLGADGPAVADRTSGGATDVSSASEHAVEEAVARWASDRVAGALAASVWETLPYTRGELRTLVDSVDLILARLAAVRAWAGALPTSPSGRGSASGGAA